MRKNALFASAVVMLMSCQNEQLLTESTFKGPEFTATTETYGAATKTSLDGDGNVLWKTNDQVSVFNGSTNNLQYQVTDESNGKTSASLNQINSGSFVAGGELPTNIAYYPYTSTTQIQKNGDAYDLTVSIPATQNYAENSFGNGTFPMVAVTSSTGDMSLTFRNVMGGLKLQLKGTVAIRSISVTGNNNEILCGPATVTANYGAVPTISLSDANAKTATLDCGETGVQLNSENATNFTIVLPPITMTGGFTIDITDTEGGTQQIQTSKSQTITRSGILKMPAVTVATTPTGPVYEYVDLGLSVKWATMNVGATAPEEYGDFYSWGETTTKTDYSWRTYKYGDGTSSSKVTKYCTESWCGYNGNIDSKTVLYLADDAARANWGGHWRMATENEWEELEDNCVWTWTTMNEIEGYKVQSKITGYTDKWLFLPAAGQISSTNPDNIGSLGGYWTSSLDGSGSAAVYMKLIKAGHIINSYYRNYGRSIRPVYSDTPDPVYDFVDLGLSVKWATFNVGATSPEEYGDFFAWGDTEPYYETGYAQENPQAHWKSGKSAGYTWSTYKYCNGSASTLTKYCNNSSYGNSGFTDSKTVLDPEDDAAHVICGGNWRMPTIAEWEELNNSSNCTWTSTNLNGISGYMIQSNKKGYTNNWIFLPMAGSRVIISTSNVGSDGCYWMSQMFSSASPTPPYAYYFKLSSRRTTWTSRCAGHSIRPVCP